MTRPAVDIGIAMRAMPSTDDAPSGDLGLVRQIDSRQLLALVDGLGHGRNAHEIASQACAEIERRDPEEPLDRMMEALMRRFRGGRGFVAVLCRIDPASDALEFCGIGNVNGRLFNGTERTLLSGPGIVGQQSARPVARRLDFPPGAVLLLHTDGISSHLKPSELAESFDGTAQEAADRMIEQHARPSDDAGVVIARRVA